MKGISTLLSTVIVISLSFAVISIVLLVGLPALERAKEAAIVNEALQNMRVLDNLIKEVASEGIGSQRSMQIKASGGNYLVSEKTNSVDFTYNIKSGIYESGTFLKEGNLVITAGTSAKASEYDLDRDGQTELVLENEILRVGIQRVGSRTNYQNINTANNIKILNFKETAANVTPADTSVIIDGYPDTSSGIGYSELVKTGEHLPRAEAVIHVNSTIATYEVLYSLQAGADFLIVRIQNAFYN